MPKVQYKPKVGDDVILRVKPFRPLGFEHDDYWTHDYDIWIVQQESTTPGVFLITNFKTGGEEERYEPDINLVPAPPLLHESFTLDGEFEIDLDDGGEDFFVEAVLLNRLEPMEDGVVEKVKVEMTAGRFEKVKELSKPKQDALQQ
jgi:hypothetical protein